MSFSVSVSSPQSSSSVSFPSRIRLGIALACVGRTGGNRIGGTKLNSTNSCQSVISLPPPPPPAQPRERAILARETDLSCERFFGFVCCDGTKKKLTRTLEQFPGSATALMSPETDSWTREEVRCRGDTSWARDASPADDGFHEQTARLGLN